MEDFEKNKEKMEEIENIRKRRLQGIQYKNDLILLSSTMILRAALRSDQRHEH